jgi:hypothetical protein
MSSMIFASDLKCFMYGTGCFVTPNVRAKLPAEAGAVSLVRDDAPCAADQAYSACRSGSA